MTIQLISYRDSYFPMHSDAGNWSQLTRVFGLPCVKFIDDGVLQINPDLLVVFDEHGKIPLEEFEHPEEAQYLFGNTGMNDLLIQYPKAITVKIEVPNIIPNQGIFGNQAAAIVLYDRERKKWQSQ